MNAKKLAGEAATKFVENNMVVGLGTGSTVYYTLLKLSQRIKEEGLNIRGVSTSLTTTKLAEELEIPLISINVVSSIDLTIDGADKVDTHYRGIKGGGGALFYEKIVAKASKKNIWVVDSSKMTEHLGSQLLPIEVLPFGFTHVQGRLKELEIKSRLRTKDGKVFKTDSGNFILDAQLNRNQDIHTLEQVLDGLTGVLEHGIFTNVVDTIIMANEEEIEIINTRL
ncbi:ribose-5-phosphate isomerase RpiA [Priestia filamentosa]|uniref:ribose 5-phosphate isomerase A n=1 Tax=Priestia filamentosa TaxID=1402861 RepID=UPI00397CE7E7